MPALPITRQPFSFAIWPATDPTAPAAPDTNTVSPSFGRPTSSRPTYAVKPGIPSTPRAVDTGASEGSTGRSPAPSLSAHSRQPRLWTTHVLSGHCGLREATTWPTAPPVSGSPTWKGGTYDFASFMRPRMYGSTETNALRISTSPSPGSRSSTSASSKSDGTGTPRGRAARRISLLVVIRRL